MQQTADNSTSSNNQSFAGLLAALTAARSRNEAAVKAGEEKLSSLRNEHTRSIWQDEQEVDEPSLLIEEAAANDEAVPMSYESYANDVASLSYEHALKANARYKPIGPIEWDLSQPFDETQAARAAANAANVAQAPRIQWDLSQPFEEPLTPKSFPQTPVAKAIAEILVPMTEQQVELVKQTDAKLASKRETAIETKPARKAKSKPESKPKTARENNAKSKSANESGSKPKTRSESKSAIAPKRKPASNAKSNGESAHEAKQEIRRVSEAAAPVQKSAVTPVSVPAATPVAAPISIPVPVRVAAPVAIPAPAPAVAPVSVATPSPVAAPIPAAVEKDPWERTSITVRLTEAEYNQLLRRAAEAGMSAAEYMRSCTMEAEVLRAQVKEVLAQLRPEKPRESSLMQAHARAREAQMAEANSVSRGSWRGWLAGVVSAVAIWSVRNVGH